MRSADQKLIRHYLGTILIAVLVALFIRIYLIEAYRIPSPAMRPTLEAGDTIFVSKWDFGTKLPWSEKVISGGRTPMRGEVVVFSDTVDAKKDYIKRVVGLPGETVSVKNGYVTIDGQRLVVHATDACGDEEYKDGGSHRACWEPPALSDFAPEKIPPHAVFLLGDYRSQFQAVNPKHRSWGIVPINLLRGKARWIWLSIEPKVSGGATNWLPQFRFERMFRRID